jgi:thiamine biosynthesis protein ThiS
MEPLMDIIVNGKAREFAGTTLADLLAELEIKSEGIAVEVNGEIIHRQEYIVKGICQGDIIEIVKFVGGG